VCSWLLQAALLVNMTRQTKSMANGCKDCGKGFYCPGPKADLVANSSTTAGLRGPRSPCDKRQAPARGSGLTTGTNTAKTWRQCGELSAADAGL
jgi:hypothetical protein